MKAVFTTEDTKKIKGFAIILMILHHCFLSPERYEGQTVIFEPFSEELFNSVTLTMKICVAIFAFISAYGITLSYKKSNAGSLLNIPAEKTGYSVYRRGVKLWTEFAVIFLLAQLYDVLVVRDGRFALVYGTDLKGILYFIIDGLGLAELFGTPTYLATFWYISLAWIIILVMPLLIGMYTRCGGAVLFAVTVLIDVMFPVTQEHTFAHFPQYAPVLAAGIICADKDLIGAMVQSSRLPKAIKFVLYLAVFAVLFGSRYLMRGTTLVPVIDAIITVDICVLFVEFINKCPLIKSILALIGRYATDIFLLHNFIRIVWYYDFTYSFRYWWAIAGVLLVLSVAVAAVIDLLKKVCRYDKLVNRLIALYPGTQR